MDLLIRCVVGFAVGSFLNVIAVRYDPDRFVLTRAVIGGRSRCPQCKRTLRWFELVPIASFLLQRGRCRTCGIRISFQHPIVELISAALFVFVPPQLAGGFLVPQASVLAALWVAVFAVLLLITLIDIRLRLIPDELVILLGLLGIGLSFVGSVAFGPTEGSMIGSYALLFGARDSILMNRIVALLVASALFYGLVALTRGRGMGMGDVKLMLALALVFGWPDILIIAALAFVLGSIVGGALMLRRRATMKTSVAFGPFIALAALVLFFWGEPILRGYFSIVTLW